MGKLSPPCFLTPWIEESDTEEEENENVILEDDDDLDLEDGEIRLDAGEIDDGNGNNDEEFCMNNNGNEIDQEPCNMKKSEMLIAEKK